MKTTTLYTYLGTNGTITTPIHLENIYSVESFQLEADALKQLTKDDKNFYHSIVVSKEELPQWYEVDA